MSRRSLSVHITQPVAPSLMFALEKAVQEQFLLQATWHSFKLIVLSTNAFVLSGNFIPFSVRNLSVGQSRAVCRTQPSDPSRKLHACGFLGLNPGVQLHTGDALLSQIP